MKVYISVDMEGVAGVTVGEQTFAGEREYERFRRLMTAEASAAVEGALAAGATEVIVNDSHGSMTNVLIEELHPAAKLISGCNKHLLQMEGIDQDFTAVMFIGYHQREGGGDGILSHTLRGGLVYEVRVQGRPVDEAAINAGIAGAFGVPVALIAGDDAVCRDVQELLPGVLSVPVKTAINRFTALSMTPERARGLIRTQAEEAVRTAAAGRLRPYQVAGPVRFEVDFKNTSPAMMSTILPGVERIGPRSIALESDDYLSAFKLFWASLIVGASVFQGKL